MFIPLARRYEIPEPDSIDGELSNKPTMTVLIPLSTINLAQEEKTCDFDFFSRHGSSVVNR